MRRPDTDPLPTGPRPPGAPRATVGGPARHLPTYTVEKPRCPRCLGKALTKYRSLRDIGDGASLYWMRCANEECGHRFRIVAE